MICFNVFLSKVVNGSLKKFSVWLCVAVFILLAFVGNVSVINFRNIVRICIVVQAYIGDCQVREIKIFSTLKTVENSTDLTIADYFWSLFLRPDLGAVVE